MHAFKSIKTTTTTKNPNNGGVVVPQNTKRNFTTNSKNPQINRTIPKEKKEKEDTYLAWGHF